MSKSALHPAFMNTPALLTDRTVIRLTGEDRFPFLQGIVTEDIEKLKTAPAIFTALLTPQGKILFDFFVVRNGESLHIDCFKDAAEALMKRLSLYKLRAKVSLEPATGLNVIASPVEIEGGFPDPRHGGIGWRAMASGDFPADNDYDAQRIALGLPEFGKDFGGDEMFLTDVNYDALNGVSYKKGCFIGQEVSSRMKRKGDIRRRTLIARFEGPAAEKGAPVTSGGSTLGETLGGAGDRALALIRLDRWEKSKAEGAPIECGGREVQLQFPAYLEQG